MSSALKDVASCHTGNLHLQQRQDLKDKDGDPAERIGDDDGEEPLGDGDLFFNVVAELGGLSSSSLNVVKHACIREDDDEERHQVQT